MTQIKVLYHAQCPDGFAAAMAAWLKFGEEAEYIPVKHQEPPPELVPGERVFILDFSYPRKVLTEIAAKCEVVVLDHHKTALNELSGLSYAIFDLKKSGAVLAWEYFHPERHLPELVSYVQDRDLWQHQLPHTQEVHAGLSAFRQDFQVWRALLEMPNYVDFMVQIGSPLLQKRQREIEDIARLVDWQEIGGHKVPVAYAAKYWSDVANFLCKRYPDAPFAACWREDGDSLRDSSASRIQWELRSVGDFDVSEVAVGLGGGGHRNAAGFIGENDRIVGQCRQPGAEMFNVAIISPAPQKNGGN